MVRKILTKLASPIRGLHQAAYLLAGLTLASQVLALVRDRVFATTFGAGETLDLYYAAFRIPDLVFTLVASLVSAYVLIPRIAGAGKKESERLLSETTSFLLIGGGAISVALAFLAPSLLFLIFPNFEGSPQAGEFVLLSQLLLLQPILLGLSGILTSVTQVARRFVLYALSPVLYNLGIIFGTLVLYPTMGLAGVGVGVVIGAIAHLVIHIPVVRSAGLFPKLVIPHGEVIGGVVRDSLPRSLALGMGALTTLLMTLLAARTGEGAVSVFTLAGNLQAVPLSLISASYATAAFPVLAEHINAKRMEAFRDTLLAAARHLIFWSSVIAVLAIVLRAHLVRVIYGSGEFDWDDTRLTAAVLALLMSALVAQGLVLLASRAFYAAGKSWNPLMIQLAGAAFSVLSALGMLVAADQYPMFRYFVESLLRVEDTPGTDIVFIAAGAAVGQLLMGVLALVTLRGVAPGAARELARPVSEGLAAGILGGTASYGILAYMGNIAPLSTLPAVFTQGVLAGMVGLAVSAAVLVLLENREFRDLYSSLRQVKGFKRLPPYGS